MTILCMRIACCNSKATNTKSEYVIRIAFLLQQWLHEHALLLRYTYTACLVFLIHLYIYALLLQTQYRLEEYIELGTKLINLTFRCFSFNWILLYGAVRFRNCLIAFTFSSILAPIYQSVSASDTYIFVCMCDRASYMKMTRGTNLMQQL